MFEWFGGVQNVIQILIPLFAICVSLISPKITTTSRSRRYFLPAFASWFGYRKCEAKTHGFTRGMKPTTGNQTRSSSSPTP